jgi:hypothetical protein
MNDSTLHKAVLQGVDEPLETYPEARRLCPDILNAADYQTCPWATSVLGFDWNSEKWVLVEVTCKRWGCPYCCIRKIRRLAWMSRNAAPNRLITVTVSSKRYKDPKTAWETMRAAWPELMRFARLGKANPKKQTPEQIKRGDKPKIVPCEVEYLRVLELQKNGMPHFHSMVRAPYLEHKLLLTEWRRLIGEPPAEDLPKEEPEEWAGVNIKRIDSTFRTFRYLVKYLTKLHTIPWTERHVSYSKGFFRPEDKEPVEWAKLDQIQPITDHPFKYLRDHFAWEQVAAIAEGKYMLPTYPPDPYLDTPREKLGLPPDQPTEPAPPLKQRLVPGISDQDLLKEDNHLTADGRRRKTRRKKTILPNAPTPGATAPETPF